MDVDQHENFPVASVLLPKALRAPIGIIYQVVRTAGDIADEGDWSAAERHARSADFRAGLDAVAARRARASALLFGKLAGVVAQYRLPLAPRGAWPAVAAVVPARNEVDVIAQAVTTLLQQDYPGEFHVIVVDDHSTDGTADAARAAALQLQCPDDRLTVLSAKPLPPGWLGKVWAQSQGIEAVHTLGLPADFLLFTDADIGHPADAVAQLVARAEAEKRDLVSLMVRLRCDSFWEKALIPAFVFFFAKLYPFSWVNNPRNRTAAVGSCMLVRRSALEEAGGIESIRAELIDDCSLAARIKHRGTGRPDPARRGGAQRLAASVR